MPGVWGGASGGMGLEVGYPTTTDHVAGNAAGQNPAAARIIRLLYAPVCRFVTSPFF